MTGMLDIDRVSLGWQPWLSPRQTQISSNRLCGLYVKPEDEAELFKLQEWFGHAVEIHKRKLGAILTGGE